MSGLAPLRTADPAHHVRYRSHHGMAGKEVCFPAMPYDSRMP